MSPRLFAILVVLSGTVTAIAVSYLVPPAGFDCRHIAQILIVVMWLLSTLIDIVFQYAVPARGGHHKLRFWFIFVKDLICALSTIGGVMYAHVGIFNRCSCYTNWGRTGLALPAMPHVKNILAYRIRHTYPAIIFAGIVFQLVFIPIFVLVKNRNAVRVFLQKDHGESNASWLWKLNSVFHRSASRPQPISSPGGALRVPTARGDVDIGGGARRPHPFQRLNSDDIPLVKYSSRDKTRHVS